MTYDDHPSQRPETVYETVAAPQGGAAFGFQGGVSPLRMSVPTPERGRAPSLHVHLGRIRQNAALLARASARQGVRLMGVTKGVCGEPRIARAMLDGGVQELGDSRLENLRRLRSARLAAPLWLIRLPQVSLAAEVVEAADGSLNSEITTLRALSQAARALGRQHRVILMVDLGDRREGLMPQDVVPAAREAMALPGLKLEGIGTNLTCFGAVCPTPANLGLLAALARDVEDATGLRLQTVSGGNSSSLPLLEEGDLPAGVNHLRLGEAILLGREPTRRSALPGARPDAFMLEAEVIELKRKPSLPEGITATDAFGRVPELEDRGVRCRAICAIGRQDIMPEGLQPALSGAQVLGASSDHLVLDVEEVQTRVGDRIRFIPDYGALLAATTSPYVSKVFVE